ncbi:energy-coupling factor transporter transmembrane protein EcfT [uncultured Anaerococcus sp.]|uniref:energy-coupling factor transporter transmembrane component T family protein n=1 Tax=Anaerococcus sp. AH8042_DFU013_CI05 TaxID=3385202 RepID=UPI0025EBDB4F|nr:energy-coupling factor transporter transmembrane component T [uncultured Anaerococcus sp.]
MMKTRKLDNVIDSLQDKFSIDYFRNQVLKNAYGNDDTPIAKLDPRILILWYLFLGIVPWFSNNLIFLASCFILVAITTMLAKVAGLVLFVFLLGVLGQTGYMLIAVLIFGGNLSSVGPLLILTLKVATVSLASVTVFSGMDPDNLSNGLMWFGIPEQFTFSISYAYRILPILMTEFQNVLLSFRLRSKAPSKEGFKGKIKYIWYRIKIIMNSFYPLILNTAKKTRTTVEALEIKGYRYAANNKEVKKLKLKSLKVTYDDLIFLLISFIWIMVTVLISAMLKGN